jgi:hypothetical protein
MIGNRLVFRLSAAQAVTSSTALVDATGLTTSIAANQILHARFYLPFSVGAAGGLKFQIVGPAGPANISTGIYLFDTVTPAVISGQQTTSTPFANALAVAGSHFAIVECDWKNGATAGSFGLQIAQNSSNGTPFTLLAGAWMEVTKL